MASQFERLKNVAFPKDIGLSEQGSDTLVMQMKRNGLGLGEAAANMQNNAAAFEAWALVIKSHGYDKVILKADIPDSLDHLPHLHCNQYLHYNRFLYRAQRFCDNFDWFTLSDNLKLAVSAFSHEVFDKKRNLKLNTPNNSGTAEPNRPKSKTERYFIENPDKLRELTKVNTREFFPQLPVGLFSDKVDNGTMIFPGGKAAIDLWAIEENSGAYCIHVVELKKGANKSIGVLSELFFYVNFVYDFYCRKLASPGCISEDRGYAKLSDLSPKRVCGHIMVENKHPELDSALAQLALCRNKNIRFKQAITYKS
jgi:phage anti-repressor protein